MAEFCVSEETPLRPDPDIASEAHASLLPSDRITGSVSLGEWLKVSAKGGNGRSNKTKAGWVQLQNLLPVAGIAVKLHPEPLSATFEELTGTVQEIATLANWKKVRVDFDGQVREGWIDTAAESGNKDVATPQTNTPPPPPLASESELSLGVNDIYRDAILLAHKITGIDAAALAALIDAEADKIRSGPNRGQWDRNCLNAQSGAGGLTQFLRSTWIGHAKNPKYLLNKAAKEKGYINGQNVVVREADLLALRFDPELSIVSGAEFGITNLRILEDKGLVPPGIGDDDRARYIYLAHHEGVAGAEQFLKNRNSASFEKFAAQVGRQRAANMVEAAGGDVALAYRTWLNGYMDEKIQPARFRKSGTIAPSIVVATQRALADFNGPAIPFAAFGGRQDLVLETQQILTRLGYLDPPADGRFGPVSFWSLAEFCKDNDLSTDEGFTRDIARTLLNPRSLLPEIKRTGGWFDKVVSYMKGKNYWISRHPRCFNVIYLEGANGDGTLNDDRPNVFNDLRVIFFVDPSGTPILRSWEGTTEPGTYWTINPMNPAGAARIAFNQYKSWIVGTHMRNHEALVQVQPVAVHRDLNKDYMRTNDRVDTGLFGINQHWGYDAPKDNLGSTSAGCLVGRTKQGHRDFMTLIKSDARFVVNPSYRFMSAILPADEVLG